MIERNIDHFNKGLYSEVESKFNKIFEKWKTGYDHSCTKNESIILENTLKVLNETNATSDISGYNDFILKLARRTYNKLLAKDIVSIQPITGPVAKVFYLDPEITTGGTHTTFVDEYTSMRNYLNWNASRGALTVTTGSSTALTSSQVFSGSPISMPYSGGQEGLSSLKIWEQAAGVTVSGINLAYSGFGGSISTQRSPAGVEANPPSLCFDNSLSTNGFWFNPTPPFIYVRIIRELSAITTTNRYRIAVGASTSFAPTGWQLSGITGIGGTFELIDEGTKTDWTTSNYYDKTYPDCSYLAYALNVTSFSATNGLAVAEIQLFNEVTTPGASSGVSFSLTPQNWKEDLTTGNNLSIILHGSNTGSTYYSTWEDYATLEGESDVQRIKLNVSSATIESRTRKLKSSYTDEFSQDFEAYFSSNLGSELIELMSTEIAIETDREIIKSLINIAPYKSEWFYDYKLLSGVPATYFFSGDQRDIPVTISANTYDRIAKETLWVKINQMDSQIRKSNIYHGANFIVCSTAVGAIIEGMLEFTPNSATIIDPDLISYVGMLGSRFKVYIDPYLPRNILLMGYKGDNWDAGYIYAPYTMATPDQPARDPDQLFTVSNGFMSRYATKIVTNTKYGVINCIFPSSGEYKLVNEDL